MARRTKGLTERDRYWLRHQAACAGSGLSAKGYARRQRLSVHAFYQSRKRLRAVGALEPAKAARGGASGRQAGKGHRFVRVAAARRPAAVHYRVRLPNGVEIAWEGAAGAELADVLRAAGALG